MLTTLNVTFLHKYHMSYDLMASFIQQEMNVDHLHLHQFPDIKSVIEAAEKNKIDIIIINSSCLFDNTFQQNEIKKALSRLHEIKNITTIFLAQNMNKALLKKVANAGVDIMISSQDTPQELIKALKTVMFVTPEKPYISHSLQEVLQQENAHLTPKEWEVINLIQEGHTLSEIASKKCRAMSTVSNQKRNAMNKLNLRNENELLIFLHQKAFF